jgi:hypothetical protein
MKKILKIVLPLIVVIGLVIFLCIKVGIIANQKERFFYNKLESFINSNKTEIPLKELTNFEWDYVCFINPYGGILNEKFRYYKLDKKLPSNNDSRYSIVFFQINKKIGIVLSFNRDARGVIKSDLNQNICNINEESFLKKKQEEIIFN